MKTLFAQLKKIPANKIFATACLLLVMGFLVNLFVCSTTNDDDLWKQNFRNDYRIYALPIDDNLTFATEPVPTKDFEVYERIDRELLVNVYWQSSTMQSFKLANRWFPIYEKILKEEGIPDDFKYLAVIESGLRNVTSSANAVGHWQFLETTGRQYGLEITDEVDERYDPAKSTRAACHYFKDAYAQFGSWTAAAAAYNMGIGGLRRKMNEQRQTNYYNLQLVLETARYVPRILAMKTIMKNPKRHGYHFRKKDVYQTLTAKALGIETPIDNWADFAIGQGISFKHLKAFNPWIQSLSLRGSKGKTYTVLVPDAKQLEKGGLGVNVFEEDFFRPDSLFEAFPPVQTKENTKPLSLPKIKITEHKVQKRETLLSISVLYGVSVDDLVLWNGLKDLNIKKGQVLIIKQ